MEVRKIKVGYLQTNCYILVDEGKCIVIDPGDQFYSIQDQIGNNKFADDGGRNKQAGAAGGYPGAV